MFFGKGVHMREGPKLTFRYQANLLYPRTLCCPVNLTMGSLSLKHKHTHSCSRYGSSDIMTRTWREYGCSNTCSFTAWATQIQLYSFVPCIT